MDISYADILKLFPVQQVGNATFKDTLLTTLRQFEKLCANADVPKWITDEIQDICKTIRNIVSAKEKGLHYTAFRKITNLLRGAKLHKGLSYNLPFSTLKVETSLYRIRIRDEKKKFRHDDMFHIPLNRKGIIQTQRYSSPGYPCLYVGESIYGCWEEMHRHTFDSCMVSRLVNNKELKLLDMRIPSKPDFEGADNTFLLTIPLIIASSVIVKNPDDVYKPEYIIPQLLTEWIIYNNNHSRNNKDKIYGIRYTSSLITSEFEFPKEKLNNIAFLILAPTEDKKYCPVLSDLFRITDPTCNEYEKLKCGYGIDFGKTGYEDKEKELLDNYNSSDFGNLESRLCDENKFPLKEIKG